MKILVIGANGRTGKELIKLLGNEAIKFKGNILDYKTVDGTVKGVDAVISVVGHGKKSAPDMQTRGILNVVKAMNKHGVKRLVSLTGNGVRLSGDKIRPIDWMLNVAIKLIDPNRVKDGKEHAKIMADSDLDWTLIRVLKLSDGKAKNDWELKENGPAMLLVSRADTAQAIVEVITEKSFIRQSPIISSK